MSTPACGCETSGILAKRCLIALLPPLNPAACDTTKQRVQAVLDAQAGYTQAANATGDYLLPWDADVKDYLAFGPKEVANLAFEPGTPMFGTGPNYQSNRTCAWWFFSTL